jgi:hypothetical protein
MKGFPGPKVFGMELAAWEDFRQRKTSHAAGSMPASGHGAGGLYFFKKASLSLKIILNHGLSLPPCVVG